MAAPMRDSSLDGGHRPRVADSRTTAKAESSNFEYDDNEWDIGIGDLIIDLDADIEKTNEGAAAAGSMASTGGGGPGASGKSAAKQLAVEHSATVDKGLKMKIKRTKPGTKTSEAKHEIVKSNEQAQQAALQQNGTADLPINPSPAIPPTNTASTGASNATPPSLNDMPITPTPTKGGKHPSAINSQGTVQSSTTSSSNSTTPGGGNSKRGSSSHRRDKTRDKPEKPNPKPASTAVQLTQPTPASTTVPAEVNGVLRVGNAPSTPQVQQTVQRPATPQQQRVVFPASGGGPGQGPGPPGAAAAPPNAPGPPASPAAPAAATAQGSAAKPEQTKVAAVVIMPSPTTPDDRCGSPPPKKAKTSLEPKVRIIYRF